MRTRLERDPPRGECVVEVVHLRAPAGQISQEQRIKLKNLSGNEAHYTACCLLVISKNSCSKFHCQKVFDFTLTNEIVNRFDLNHTPPDSGECQFKSRA